MVVPMNEGIICAIGIIGSCVIIFADEADTGWEKLFGCLIVFLSMMLLILGVK